MTNPPSHESSFSNFTNRLPENTRRALLASASCREYRAGEIICAQGVPADAMYFVLAGMVQLDCTDLGTRVALAVGESYGESEVIRGARYTVTAMAVSDARLWVLEKGALDTLLEKHSALSFALSRHIASKFQAARTRPIPPYVHPIRVRNPNAKIALGALTAFFLVAIVFSLALVALTATTVKVEGFVLTSAPLENQEDDAPAAPTKIARWIGSPESTPTPKVSTTTPTRLPTRTAIVKPVATKTPRPQPTSTTAIAAPAMAAPIVAPTLLPREWKMPAWTSVEDANVPVGQKYFRLVKAIYFDEGSAGGRVNILVGVLDESGNELAEIPVRMAWSATEYATRKTGDKRDPFLIPYNLNVIAAHDMAGGSSFAPDRGERGGYRISIQDAPSDVVSGMGLPLRHHVAFLLVFQRTTR